MASRYEALREEARKWKPAELQSQLRAVAADPRFAAVVGWLETNREAWGQSAAAQSLASNPGKQSHACGSLHLMNVLCAQLRAVLDKKSEG